jgi:pyruvate dehydrogenase E2 component (dihydrolipoamide acetyltransferase)
MQLTIAERMTKAKQQVPHYYVTSQIDMSEATRMLAGLEAAGDEAATIGYNELIIKAAALALKKYSIVNASYVNGKLQYHERINIGIAVALPDGLMVPALHDVDEKGLRELATETRAVVKRVREGRMTASDFEGATFSVSNLGMFDVEQFAAVIDPPESGILAIGSVQKVPVVRDNEVTVGETMKVTLSADHRVYYGATAAQFLQEFKRLLQNPILLVV